MKSLLLTLWTGVSFFCGMATEVGTHPKSAPLRRVEAKPATFYISPGECREMCKVRERLEKIRGKG